MPEPALIGLAWALLVVCVASSAWLSYRSLPSALRRTLDQAVEIALSAAKRCEEVEGAWAEEKRRLAALVEADTDLLERVEKKRARVSSENRRAEQLQPQTPGDRKSELRRRASMI